MRAAVALNSKTPAEVLEVLAADEMVDYNFTSQKNRYLVKEATACNPGTNHETLPYLANDFDEHVRAAAASIRA